jgi:hypothetical protein
MENTKQTYIIFTASHTVYCTAESYDLANEIIAANDGLVDAIVQQVNHVTGSTFHKTLNSVQHTRDELTNYEKICDLIEQEIKDTINDNEDITANEALDGILAGIKNDLSA